MASIEKLTKALEALKGIQAVATTEEPQKRKEAITKKEKILHCHTIAETICSHTLRFTSDFPKVLGFTVEAFLFCCDDEDSDVRWTANECLNKTIKTLLDSHLNRLQVELYKEIKKDGNARSLRAALSRFADLCHRIRPEKFRPYAVNLLPCLAKICQRSSDESVQDTLAVAVAKIIPVLGQFTTDKEIKMLLKAFLPNLTNNSAIVRRASASSLITVCQHSRRPTVFYSWLLTALFDIILPVQDNHSVYTIHGVLLCFRHLVTSFNLPNLTVGKTEFFSEQTDEISFATKPQILKVYEVILYYTSHPDHNVVTATLEALYQLLKCAPETLLQAVLSPSGISQSSIYVAEMNKLSRAKSESQSSMFPSQSILYDDSALDDDRDIYLSEKSDEESQVYFDEATRSSIDQADELSCNIECVHGDASDYTKSNSSRLSDENFVSSVPDVHISGTPKKISPGLKTGASEEKQIDTDEEFWGDQSSTCSPMSKLEFKVGTIGSFLDCDVPLKYCTRLLCSSFLLSGLPGNLMPDPCVRISVKSLTLSCLSCIFSYYPNAFCLDLHSSSEAQDSSQKIWDIILYADHHDPHLKGQAAVVVGHFIHSVLKASAGWWDKWAQSSGGCPSLEILLKKLISVVEDSSAVASKLGLMGVKQCLNSVLESMHGFLGFSCLDSLLSLKDSSYWLTKVELLDVISEIKFKVVYYLEKEKCGKVPMKKFDFQSQFLYKIFIPMLGDEDFRVRRAAAQGILKLISKLFFSSHHPFQDPLVAIAKENTDRLLGISYQTTNSWLPLVHGLVMPFCNQDSVIYSEVCEGVLTEVINVLVTTLQTCKSQHLKFGCCHALCLLSETYMVTTYPQSWRIVYDEQKSIAKPNKSMLRHQNTNNLLDENSCDPSIQCASLFNLLTGLLTHTTLALDITAHQHVLQLIGNLMCGAFYLALEERQSALQLPPPEEKDSKELMFKIYIEPVFIHVMRLLSIFSHVLDEQPPITISNRPALPSLPNAPSLSPMKRRTKVKDEITSSANSPFQNRSPSRVLPDKSEVDKDKASGKTFGSIGTFHTSPLYTKLYAILKDVYASYKISADFKSSEKFCQLLKCALDVMAQLLEITDSQEMSKHAEEVLSYLKSAMTMESCSSVQCVKQLLKSLFGTNLIALCQETQMIVPESCHKHYYGSSQDGLYHLCIMEPYTIFTRAIANNSVKSGSVDSDEEMLSSLSWMKRGDKLTHLLKSGNKGDKVNLAAHIKLFEAVVIKALKLYTVTSDVNLQCQVLDLLAQLVQLRVNYCLLDSDQIFIGFIMKQIEYIEEGQVLKADVLIPHIFYFLVLLSYERYHSKFIISVPKILQLCDGLIASGQPPEDYVIKALQPVVEDLFLVRGMNKVDLCKELDAQREVVISTLFKLLQFPQVSELFLLIINQTFREGEDKWRKLSRQIVDALLPLLARQQFQIDSQLQLNTLHKLLETVASSVFRPVDILLKALFTQPKDLNVFPNLHRWMSMVLVILRVLICQSREEVVLSRMFDMGISVNIYKLNFTDKSQVSGLSSYEVSADSSHDAIYMASITFARFVFQIIGITAESIYSSVLSNAHPCADENFLCQQMAHMLLYLMYMFQSGTFRRVTSSAMDLIKNESSVEQSVEKHDYPYYTISEINQMFINLSSVFPTMVIQWFNVLTLLNYSFHEFWTEFSDPLVLVTSQNSSSRHSVSAFYPCNTEIVRRGGIALLCDYVVCENPNDAELMTLLIMNHINDLVLLSVETTVQDFFSSVNRNPAASGLLIQAVYARCTNLHQPVLLSRALRMLRMVHHSQSANLLYLLIEKFIPTHHLFLLDTCDEIACERTQSLLHDSSSEQLNATDVEKLISHLTSNMQRRHKKLLFLLKELQNVLLQGKSYLSTHPLSDHVGDIYCFTELNKDWFIRFVKKLCLMPLPPIKECALLLSHLKYEDALKIMACKEFHLSILEKCLKLGADMRVFTDKSIPGKSNDPFLGIKNSTESPLYRAARTTLLSHVTHIINLMPKDIQDIPHMNQLFSDESFRNMFFCTVSCVSTYLKVIEQFFEHHNIPEESLEDISHLGVFCCELLFGVLSAKKTEHVSPRQLHLSLELLNCTLKNPSLFAVINVTKHTSWIFTIVEALYHLVVYMNPKLPLKLIGFPQQTLKAEQEHAHIACVQIAAIVEWLESTKRSKNSIPLFIFEPLRSIIKGLSRHPAVNSFCRTPPILWQMEWNPEFVGDLKTLVPPPPGEYLQERDVLKQYIYRINFQGWISRQQFEETWMALLGVLSATPIDEVEGKEEDKEHIRTSCLAVKSITSLLLQTLLLPEPGNPQNSLYLLQPREKSLNFLHTKCGKKLWSLRNYVHRALKEVKHQEGSDDQFFNLNTERVTRCQQYSMSQVSLEYLCAAAGFLEENDEADESVSSNSSPLSSTLGGPSCYHQREQSLAAAGLDIHSCLHFLLDLYSQWLSPVSCPCTPLMLLTEVVRSVVILSDIFMERAQFEWLLDTLLEVQRIHPAEDEIIAQYLIFGICKAAAVLGLEPDVLDRLKKLLEVSLKSTFLPTRIATLHGFVYLLEQISGAESVSFLPAATEYVLKYLDSFQNTSMGVENEDHWLITWAISFYIMENYQDVVADFSQKIFKLCICGKLDDVPNSIYLSIIHGLERLLVAGAFSLKDLDILLKFAEDRIVSTCSIHSLSALGLLLSCMYIGKSNNLWLPQEVISSTFKPTEHAESNMRQIESDNLITAFECVTTLFERIRKGYPFESEVICQVLPAYLIEFFPLQDVLNKVIGEFLSSQQPHPQFVAGVIYEVFQYLHLQSYEDVIQDWVMLSLSNFTQKSPLHLAIWSLSCFFICATSNQWLQAIFPYIQNEMENPECIDATLFCISGVDFRNSLKDEKQRQSYFTTIQSVSDRGTLYARLLGCLK